MDVTVEFLTGALIQRCERLKTGGLLLETDHGRVIVESARTRAELRCDKCGELRMVEIVETAGGQCGFCSVCAHSWYIKQAVSAARAHNWTLP